jgi:uncharacterized DUF497 family protein
MDFEWDEAKRLSNVEKHGFDFVDADLIFRGPILVGRAKAAAGEERWLAVGLVHDTYAAVVFTYRGEITRLISIRRARDGERKRYQEIFGSGA